MTRKSLKNVLSFFKDALRSLKTKLVNTGKMGGGP